MPNNNTHRGRPALNNVRHLFDAIREASDAGNPLTVNQVCERFHWTFGTARSMVSRVRAEHNVVINLNRHTGQLRMNTAMTRTAIPVIQVNAQDLRAETTVMVSPEGPVDTIESMAAEIAACASFYNTNEWVYCLRLRISGAESAMEVSAFFNAPQYDRIVHRARAFIARERARVADQARHARSAAPRVIEDSLFREIPNAVVTFYRERALDLAR